MKYFNDYVEKAQTALFDEMGAFFAFSKAQFDEQKKPGVIYVNAGAGLLCPQENVKPLFDRFEAIIAEGVKLDIAENGAEAIIEREYFNHETQLMIDKQPALDAISAHREQRPDLFTDEVIKRVFADCYKKAIENNWF